MEQQQIHAFLNQQWQSIIQQYPAMEEKAAANAFQEIIQHYQQTTRHYHNLNHLYEIFKLLAPHQSQLKNKTAVHLAVFYHDIIYKALKKDNELKSAEFAQKALQKLGGFSAETIAHVYQLILATKTHEVPSTTPPNTIADFHFLLDADLAILGASPTIYQQYTQQIRKEYRLVPKLLYKPGRKKVLEHLLHKNPIYYTAEFANEFEASAKKNIAAELSLL